MSDASTTRMIEMYMEEASAPLFLSGFFRSPAKNFHRTEKIGIDIIRDDEDIAITIQDISAGARTNQVTKLTNKEYTPPIFNEEAPIVAYEQMRRPAGASPFEDPDYAANAVEQTFSVVRKLENKIRRSQELMASQVLQTGQVTLTDENSANLYVLAFGAKTTHMVQTGTAPYGAAWAVDGSTGTPLADLQTLSQVVRRDGKGKPEKLLFGPDAMNRFLANADVKERLDNRAMTLGSVAPEVRGEGATFMGWVWIGHYRFEMWMYDGFYRDPATGNQVDYISPGNVVMLSSNSRFDLSFGAIPIIKPPSPEAMAFLPNSFRSGARGLDLNINAYITPNGRTLMVEAGTRPLTIPTAIDTYARLDVTQ